MRDKFIPYELALKLEELGFDEKCFTYFNKQGSIRRNLKLVSINQNITLAPLWQQAFDWFREKHNLDSFRRQTNLDGKSYWSIKKIETRDKIKGYSSFTDTYEEARQGCLEKLIEIVEQQNK